MTRIERALNLPEDREVLLLRSFTNFKYYTASDIEEENDIKAAIVDLPRPNYTGWAASIDTSEHCWLHAKLSQLAFPLLDLQKIAFEGYGLTHAIFHASDFGRLSLNHLEAYNIIEARLNSEFDLDLLAEFALCFEILGGSIPATTMQTLLNYYDQVWDENINLHTVKVIAVLLARMEHYDHL